MNLCSLAKCDQYSASHHVDGEVKGQCTSRPTKPFTFQGRLIVYALLWGAAKIKTRRGGDSATVTELTYRKVTGIKTCHSPMTLEVMGLPLSVITPNEQNQKICVEID